MIFGRKNKPKNTQMSFKVEKLGVKPEEVYPDSPAIRELYDEMERMSKRYKKKMINPDLVALISTVITLFAFLMAPFYSSIIEKFF